LDVDEIYQSLPLDKIEAMENSEAISIVLPAVGIKDKVLWLHPDLSQSSWFIFELGPKDFLFILPSGFS
jgi:hypothetical protein